MATLKETKARIASVRSTLKITSAMKLVASAKLRKAQQAAENCAAYERELAAILEAISLGGGSLPQPVLEEDAPKPRVALVALSSNSSLCGGFNNNVIKKARSVVEEIGADGWLNIVKEVLRVYPGQTKPKHYGTLVKWRLGGNDPLDGISIYDGGDFYHFVTFGLTELYEKQSRNTELSGYGYEMTLKLKKYKFEDEEAEIKNICGIPCEYTCGKAKKTAEQMIAPFVPRTPIRSSTNLRNNSSSNMGLNIISNTKKNTGCAIICSGDVARDSTPAIVSAALSATMTGKDNPV